MLERAPEVERSIESPKVRLSAGPAWLSLMLVASLALVQLMASAQLSNAQSIDATTTTSDERFRQSAAYGDEPTSALAHLPDGQVRASGSSDPPASFWSFDRADLTEPTPDARTESIEIGRRLYLGRGGCIGCHIVNGEGGSTGPDLSHIGSTAGTRRPEMSAEAYIRESLVQPKAYLVPGYPPVMPAYRELLTDDEIEHLVQYSLSLK